MVKYFEKQFAVDGDYSEIPDGIQSNGSVSYQTGFGVDYQRKLGSDPLAKPFSRQGFNGLIYDMTGAIQQYQQNGFFDFITPNMNKGEAFSYAMGATIRYDMSDAKDGSDVHNFTSLINNNTGNPKDNPDDWQEIGKSDIKFATDEEIANKIDGKAIDPKGLASVNATTTCKGLIQIATDEVFNGKTNESQAITTAQYHNGFSKNKLSENGYQVLPSGLILQWLSINHNALGNEAEVSFVFPIAFNTVFQVILSSTIGNTAGSAGFSEGAEITSYTSTGGNIVSAWHSRTAGKFRIFAIGV